MPTSALSVCPNAFRSRSFVRLLRRGALLLVILIGIAASMSCDGAEVEFSYIHRVRIEKGVDRITCRCEGANAVYLKNGSDKTELVTWEGIASQGGATSVFGDTLELPGRHIRPIGCTVSAFPACDTENSHRIVQVNAKLSNQAGPAALAFKPESRLEACAELCEERRRGCLRFGRGALKVVTPINQLYNSAIAEGRESIPSAEVLSRYGLSSEEDGCKRGNTVLGADGILKNDADSDCIIRAFDYLATTMGVQLNDARELSNLTLLLPKTIKGKSHKAFTVFADDDKAAAFKFTGDRADLYNDLYGGRVQQVGRFGNHFILSTTNGCISVPAVE